MHYAKVNVRAWCAVCQFITTYYTIHMRARKRERLCVRERKKTNDSKKRKSTLTMNENKGMHFELIWNSVRTIELQSISISRAQQNFRHQRSRCIIIIISMKMEKTKQVFVCIKFNVEEYKSNIISLYRKT